MKEILNKISSYNLFNYLLPGTVFVFALSKMSAHNFIQKDLLIGAFLYYFIGLIISRIGSVVIEPILKKWKFLKFAEYSDYVIYSRKEKKIEILSETNNMYRTIVSLIFSLVLVKAFDWITVKIGIGDTWQSVVILTLLLALFLFSYRKQTNYITKRIKANKENNNTQQGV